MATAAREVEVATMGTTREHRCSGCGTPLGVVTRDRGGPTVLTPYPGVALAQVTGGVVWLRCACGGQTPWFVLDRKTLRQAG